MRKLLLPTIIIALMIAVTAMVLADEEEPIKVVGHVTGVDSNDLILELEDGSIITVNTCPKWYADLNELLETLVCTKVTVVGEPKYDEEGYLVEIDAYQILDAAGNVIIDIRGPGKPPWSQT